MFTNEAVDYLVIEDATGVIKKMGTATIMDMPLQIREGHTIMEDPGGVFDDTHYWNGQEFQELPPAPGDAYIWTGAEWIDPRSPEDVAAEAQARIEAARAAASLSRADLLLAAVGAGLIPASEAGAAARGEVPPSMEALFASLPPETQIEAVIRWGASTVIDRTNPILLALAEGLGATEADLDALFGIAPAT